MRGALAVKPPVVLAVESQDYPYQRMGALQDYGIGMLLFAKRLERGRFIWPKAESGSVSLTRAQLSMLLEGIDWRQPARTWKPEMAV